MYKNLQDIISLFYLEDEKLFKLSQEVCRKYIGNRVYLRGIIEFSNLCDRNCLYCGISSLNTSLERYHLSSEEILRLVDLIYSFGIRTVVLQSGEFDSLDEDWLANLITDIKKKYDIAITLSVGEKSFDTYKKWKEAGADRYLLKIETTNPKIYTNLHPNMSLEKRMECLSNLKILGYETGSGSLIGLPNQTIEDIAKDIWYFKQNEFEMIGTGPFIPHKATPLKDYKAGNPFLVLKTIAVTRIVLKTANIPATTALGSLDKDYRIEGLKYGANVLMPNFTPQNVKAMYEIYPNKRCLNEPSGTSMKLSEDIILSAGKYIDWAKGSAKENFVLSR